MLSRTFQTAIEFVLMANETIDNEPALATSDTTTGMIAWGAAAGLLCCCCTIMCGYACVKAACRPEIDPEKEPLNGQPARKSFWDSCCNNFISFFPNPNKAAPGDFHQQPKYIRPLAP